LEQHSPRRMTSWQRAKTKRKQMMSWREKGIFFDFRSFAAIIDRIIDVFAEAESPRREKPGPAAPDLEKSREPHLPAVRAVKRRPGADEVKEVAAGRPIQSGGRAFR